MGYCYFRIPSLVCFSLRLFILGCRVLCLVSVFVFGRSSLCLVVSCLGSLCVIPCLRVEDHF